MLICQNYDLLFFNSEKKRLPILCLTDINANFAFANKAKIVNVPE